MKEKKKKQTICLPVNIELIRVLKPNQTKKSKIQNDTKFDNNSNKEIINNDNPKLDVNFRLKIFVITS